jgi:hypothetical protein
MNRTVAGSEQLRLALSIFSLEHELSIGGHQNGYSCMKCWRMEDEDEDYLRTEWGIRP